MAEFNELMLHFFILDQLHMEPEGMTAASLCDTISRSYGVVFDSQTLRLKLKEYESKGILQSKARGRSQAYFLVPRLPLEDSPHLLEAVEFFQGAAPFGFIGSTLLDREDKANTLFQFKHLYIVHTLEDEVLKDVLGAIHGQRMISYENKSGRNGSRNVHTCVPLKIFVSTRTGRRYMCHYLPRLRRSSNARLDSIQKVVLLEPCEAYAGILSDLEQNMGKCWGVSFGSGNSRLEEVCIKLYIDEEKEPYILNRLYRESRGGEVMKIREHEYLYRGLFFDTNEMLSWIKTFTGRIMDIQGTNSFAVAKITHDWEKMYQMYCMEEA